MPRKLDPAVATLNLGRWMSLGVGPDTPVFVYDDRSLLSGSHVVTGRQPRSTDQSHAVKARAKTTCELQRHQL